MMGSPASYTSEASSGFFGGACSSHGPVSNGSMISGSPTGSNSATGDAFLQALQGSPAGAGGSVTSGHHSDSEFDSDASVENNLVAHGGGGGGGSVVDTDDPTVAAVFKALSEHPVVKAAVETEQQQQGGVAAPSAVDIDLSLFDQ